MSIRRAAAVLFIAAAVTWTASGLLHGDPVAVAVGVGSLTFVLATGADRAATQPRHGRDTACSTATRWRHGVDSDRSHDRSRTRVRR